MPLKSARAVLEKKRRAETLEVNNDPHDRCRLWGGMLYHLFMATIVLVMDLCFNTSSSDNGNRGNLDNDGDDDETRVTRTEFLEACHILHQVQSAPG